MIDSSVCLRSGSASEPSTSCQQQAEVDIVYKNGNCPIDPSKRKLTGGLGMMSSLVWRVISSVSENGNHVQFAYVL